MTETTTPKGERHTPGPWLCAAAPSSIVGWPVVGRQGRSICNLSWIAKKPPMATDGQYAALKAETHANGRLIAAAPDLLAALVSAADMLDIADSYLSFAPGSMGGIQMKEARDQARAAIRKARGGE